MPRASTAWSSAAALWITAAGWASAMRERFGAAWVVTADAVVTPDLALEYTQPRPSQRRSRFSSLVPVELKTARSDLALLRRSLKYRALEDGPWNDYTVRLVWQQHDLFAGPGAAMARRFGVPLLSYVHAPCVWEASRWGVRRPLWGRVIERFSERRQLAQANLVACVSEEVATELVRLGVGPERVLVSPMSVDGSRFSPQISGTALRQKLGLAERFVFGWTGSFRKFHGLDLAVRAFGRLVRSVPDAALLLVGDGPERSVIERLVDESQCRDNVVFAGSVPHPMIPEYVAAMDATLVIARDDEAFHYSPLKLREYMICGKPAVIPRAGEMTRLFHDGVDCVQYDPGNEEQLRDGMHRLALDRQAASRIGAAAHTAIAREGTWDVRLAEALASLKLH
jgi:glycosyltransferase involved in cell wall biosynthesis